MRLAVLILMLASFCFAADPAEAIKQADRDFCRDTRARGLEGWLAWWGEGSYLGDDPEVRGPEKLRRHYSGLFSRKNLDFQWEPTHGEIYPSGDMGYTSGRYTLSFDGQDGKPVRSTGSYLTVWKKQKDGSWKIFTDMGSPDRKPVP